MDSDTESNDNLDKKEQKEQKEQKTINITGQNNKYQMKKLTTERNNKEPKKREVSKNWSFSEEYYNYDKQMKLINDISKNNLDDDITQTVIQEINKKISIFSFRYLLRYHFRYL